MLMGLNLI